MVGVVFDCIGSITIQVCYVGNGDKVFACFVIYMGSVILYLDFVCISIDILFQGYIHVLKILRVGCLGVEICVLDLCIVISYIWELEHIPMEDFCIKVRQRKLDYMP